MQVFGQRPVVEGAPAPTAIDINDSAAADRAVRSASKWWYTTPVITGLGAVALLVSGVVLAGYKIHNATHTSGNQYNDGAIEAATKATLGSGITVAVGLVSSLGATALKGIMDSAQAACWSNGRACCTALKTSWNASWSEFGEPQGIMINAICGPAKLISWCCREMGSD